MDNTGTGISWYVGTDTGVPRRQTDFAPTPSIGNPKVWIDIQMDPTNKSELVTVISDTNSDLFAKSLSMINTTPNFVWSNTEGGTALEVTLPQAALN